MIVCSVEYLPASLFSSLCDRANKMRCLSSLPHRDVLRIQWVKKTKWLEKRSVTNIQGIIFILTVALEASCVHNSNILRGLAYERWKWLTQQKWSLVHLAFRPQPVSQTEHCNLHSFLLACNSDWIPKQGWLLQGWLIGSFIYWRQQSNARGRSSGLQGENSRWKDAFWLSWSHGKQLSGGARELVPGSVWRKGLSYRDLQLDRYVSQESLHCPFSLSHLSLFFPLLHVVWVLGGMTNGHSLGPWVNSTDPCGGQEQILCPVFPHKLLSDSSHSVGK